MEVAFLAIILFVFGIFSLLTVFLVALLFDSIRVDVPYVPTKKEVAEQIVLTLNLKDNSVLYDIGCGDGRILTAAWRKFPTAKYVGVEKGVLPFMKAKFLTRGKQIKILKSLS